MTKSRPKKETRNNLKTRSFKDNEYELNWMMWRFDRKVS